MAVNPTLQLSPSYTVADLTISSTADRLGLNNMPTDDLIAGMKKLANVLELISSRYGSFSIISGYRSPAVNKAVGGASGSKHMTGQALDFSPRMTSITEYWANLISDVEIGSMLGEISMKPDQNAIHITLPYWKGGEYIKNSPRIKEGSGYYRITGEYGQQLLSKYGINMSKEEVAQIIKMGGIGFGVLLLGIGGLAAVWAYKRRE